jgi:hypothetical protein
MNVNATISTIRGGSVSADYPIGRGEQLGAPKKSFGQKLGSISKGVAAVGLDLDRVHLQVKAATSVAQICDLLDEYALLVAIKSGATPATAPAGRILTAALKAVTG